MSKIYIIGAGGHGQVVADTIIKMGFQPTGFLDDKESLISCKIMNIPIIGTISLAKTLNGRFIIAIGDNKIRKKIVDKLNFPDDKYLTVIHPSAIIGKDVRIGVGSMIIGGVVINTQTNIGKHTIINTAVSIDHHNTIGNFVHIAPGSHTGGNVTIGEGSFLGIGTSVIPNKKIGNWVITGAGSVVIRNIPNNCTVVGIPAKPMKFHKETQ